MRAGEWTLRGRRVMTSSGTRPADVLIRGETIAAILDHDAAESEGVILDVGDLVVIPGLVAIRRERAEASRAGWFDAATRECAALGVTTLLVLPDQSEDQTDVAPDLRKPAASMEGMIRVDCGLVLPLREEDSSHIEAWLESGFLGLEAFAGGTGQYESLQAAEAHLVEIMPALAGVGRPLFVDLGRFAREDEGSDSRAGAIVPPTLRADAVCELLIRLCRRSRCRVHLIQPPDSKVRARVIEAQAAGLPITIGQPSPRSWIETEGDVDPQGRLPLASVGREGAEEPGLESSSEVPARPEMLSAAWAGALTDGPGLVGLALSLASSNAEAIGLADRKGSIAEGLDADFCVVDPVDRPDRSVPRFNLSTLVEMTILRGNLIYEGGRLIEHARGNLVFRGEETEPIQGPRG